MALIASGEGGGARKLQGVKRYLLEGLGRRGGGRRRLVDGKQRRSAYGIGGEVAPGVEGGRGMARELRESEAELLAGSAWAEEVWNGGSNMVRILNLMDFCLFQSKSTSNLY